MRDRCGVGGAEDGVGGGGGDRFGNGVHLAHVSKSYGPS